MLFEHCFIDKTFIQIQLYFIGRYYRVNLETTHQSFALVGLAFFWYHIAKQGAAILNLLLVAPIFITKKSTVN